MFPTLFHRSTTHQKVLLETTHASLSTPSMSGAPAAAQLARPSGDGDIHATAPVQTHLLFRGPRLKIGVDMGQVGCDVLMAWLKSSCFGTQLFT